MSNNPHVINVGLTFRNVEATDAIKSYATEKITHCLEKFVHQDTEAHVVLRVEKNRQIAEVTFHLNGAHFNGKEESADLYAAIDALVDSLGHQLRKHKEKLTSHH
ncbi:MAG: ribosome-associated translation inhibitor RaiA [Proteobacteria bacterium]|nr:MAG: ribosome-associated translation inhibitor RaiA [Pseudomonadota bacterium]